MLFSAQQKADDAAGSGVGRRALLRAGALGSGSALALAAGGTATGATGATGAAQATATAATAAADVARKQPFALFTQSDLNFETLFALGSAGYGCAEVGEIVTTVNEINARGETYQNYYDLFAERALRTEQIADGQLAAGHTASARSAFLRAATYYDLCLFFVLGTRQHAYEASVYARMQRNWNAAARLFDPPFERVRIPYDGTWLPGYFLSPDSSGTARPTVILNNGSDAQNVDLYTFGGAAALERGYNALIFEGPGQGSMLFERKVPYRPDWQHVVTPIVDWLTARADVDSSRIAITGWSMCGASVIEAAGYEHRLAAVVADPGVLDAWAVWPKDVRKLADSGAGKTEINRIWTREFIPHIHGISAFTLKKRSELFTREALAAGRAGHIFTDLYDLSLALKRVNCIAEAPRVTTPALITEYEDDAFFPQGSQAGAVYARLPKHIRKELRRFTVAEGAEYHDAPMAPQTRNQVVFDWLDGVLG